MRQVHRLDALRAYSVEQHDRLLQLIELSKRGLPRMYVDGRFVHTMRATKSDGGGLRPESGNLRYDAIVALGLACADLDTQRAILSGDTAAELALRCVDFAERSDDLGAVALSAWAAAEVADSLAVSLFARLAGALGSDEPVATVACAWSLIAALAAAHLGDAKATQDEASRRLLAAQSDSGLFPHMLPRARRGSFRGHVGSFADQVYPMQALARLASATGRREPLRRAEACADVICDLQGPDGQWWWHYDFRNGSVVEGYPVYSVHQYAMGPMALLDIRDAGGKDFMDAIARGLGWLDSHPEVNREMVDEAKAVIWRKAARIEPGKAARAVSAFTTALKPGFHLPLMDRIFPPGRVDYECRPYEFGWMLYAWLGDGVVQRLADGPGSHVGDRAEQGA